MSTAPGRRYAGATAEERSAARRARLLEAGLDVIGGEGYAKTSVAEVCRRAGLTSRYFYEHFANREALLRAVHDDVVSEGFSAAQAAAEAQGDAPLEQVVTAQLMAYYGVVVDDPRKGRVQFIEVVGVSAEMEAHRRAVTRAFGVALGERIQGFVERGAIPRPATSRLTAHAILGALNELIVEHLSGAPEPREVILAESLRAAVALLRN